MMKAVHILPPIASLLAATVFLTAQRRSAESLRAEEASVSDRIERQLAIHLDRDNTEDGGTRSTGQRVKSDWKALAARFQHDFHQPGVAGSLAYHRLYDSLGSLDQEGLIEALDHLGSLGLAPDSMDSVRHMLVSLLAAKDPEYALERFYQENTNGDSDSGYALSRAFGDWAVRDPHAAAAWFDRKLAEGDFDGARLDGQNTERTRFSAMVAAGLLASDPAAAAARLGSLSAEERRNTLEMLVSENTNRGNQSAVATLIRSTLPPGEQASQIAALIAPEADEGGYAAVDAALTRVGATPAEIARVMEKAADARFSEFGPKLHFREFHFEPELARRRGLSERPPKAISGIATFLEGSGAIEACNPPSRDCSPGLT